MYGMRVCFIQIFANKGFYKATKMFFIGKSKYLYNLSNNMESISIVRENEILWN